MNKFVERIAFYRKVAFDGIPKPVLQRHLILFALTFITTTLTGYTFAPTVQGLTGFLYALSYSIPIMTILTAHEMGHYMNARLYGVPCTLPYFIPMPILSPFGTMGAFIRLQGFPADRRSLFDIAFWGPAMSFMLSVPCIIGGVALTQVGLAQGEQWGDPLLVKFIVRLFYWDLPPGDDVVMHPLLYAGWAGLLVTAINLFPIGQLDGGHIAYALLGRRQRDIAYIFMGLLIFLAFQYPGWLVWVLILVFMGIEHPPVDRTLSGYSQGLDPFRKKLAFASIFIFAVSFTPYPMQTGSEKKLPNQNGQDSQSIPSPEYNIPAPNQENPDEGVQPHIKSKDDDFNI